MGTATTNRETYAEWLTRQLEERGMTQRGLARAWRPHDFENARRAVRRYMTGMVPVARTRAEIAEALGANESGPADEDTKEGD